MHLRLETGVQKPWEPKRVVRRNILKSNNNKSIPKTDPKLAKLLLGSIIFKDKHLIAINKPEGLASQGGSHQGDRHIDAYKSTLQFGANDTPRLIHRLDKDTSGVLLLARDVKAANIFTSLFKENLIEEIYWALVEGVPQKKEGTLESYIGKLDIWKPNLQEALCHGIGSGFEPD